MRRGAEVTIRLGWQINNFSYGTGVAMANPRLRAHIPLMIGGSGEKKTIPLAARHFDHLNVIAGFDELARKVEVVKQRCGEIDRDPATLETSMLVGVLLDDPKDGVSADAIGDDLKQSLVTGSVDSVVDQIKTKVLDAGVDGVVIYLPHRSPGINRARSRHWARHSSPWWPLTGDLVGQFTAPSGSTAANVFVVSNR
jgi:alkanesulfonate monooxygenase SsuD/methylene tetrahydromethanopterin reductase-like flavin-dependent oxidoreductase (luciferase family)